MPPTTSRKQHGTCYFNSLSFDPFFYLHILKVRVGRGGEESRGKGVIEIHRKIYLED
jgi:hypothetical protein